jgi:hypothetical protein
LAALARRPRLRLRAAGAALGQPSLRVRRRAGEVRVRIFGRNRDGLCLAYRAADDMACTRARWHNGDHRFFLPAECVTAEDSQWMFDPEQVQSEA